MLGAKPGCSSALGTVFFRPNGARHTSPGHRPGASSANEPALAPREASTKLSSLVSCVLKSCVSPRLSDRGFRSLSDDLHILVKKPQKRWRCTAGAACRRDAKARPKNKPERPLLATRFDSAPAPLSAREPLPSIAPIRHIPLGTWRGTGSDASPNQPWRESNPICCFPSRESHSWDLMWFNGRTSSRQISDFPMASSYVIA